jgi:hypothetical protein
VLVGVCVFVGVLVGVGVGGKEPQQYVEVFNVDNDEFTRVSFTKYLTNNTCVTPVRQTPELY